MRIFLTALAAAWLAAAIPANAESVPLHPEVWEAYQAYLGTRWPGAFAVSRDGAAHGSAICRTVRCDISTAKRDAVRNCASTGGGTDCVIFAVRDDIRLDYRILSREEASVCPLSPVPKIAVSLRTEEPGFDHSRDVAALAEMMMSDDSHWLDEHGTFMGVTEQYFRDTRDGFRFVTVDGRNGATCAGFTDGRVRLALRAVIYIAREIPKDTCLYRDVLEHEKRHERLGAEMMADFARELEARIAADLAEQPFVEVPEGAYAWRTAADRLDSIIRAARAVFDREHSRRQLAIDSDAEYARTEMTCPGEADKFLP